MSQFAGITFEVSPGNTDALGFATEWKFDVTIRDDRLIELGYLITFGRVGVEIVFAVKLHMIGQLVLGV